MLAFSGVQVDAVDINPLFIELTEKRAKNRNLCVNAFCCEFDRFQTENKYDMVLFYESLHHIVCPWKTIEHISQFLKKDGVFILAGEPFTKRMGSLGSPN